MLRRVLLAAIVPLVFTTLSPARGQGLVGWWKLDETTGVVASDSSGSGNVGTLLGFTGTPWVAGMLSGGLQFDGVNDYVALTQTGGLPIYDRGTYAVTFWVMASAQTDTRVYSEGSSVSNYPLFTLGSGATGFTTKLRAYIRADNNGLRLYQHSTADVFDGQWHHVAWVDHEGDARLYVDGTLDASDFSYDWTPITLDRSSIGAVLRATACCFLAGTVDDLRTYAHALTQTDVAAVATGATLPMHFQLNQTGASCDIDGVVGSPATAAQANVALNAPFTLNISSTSGGLPWDLVATTSPAVPNALVFAANILNQSLADPSLVLLNGSFQTTWGVQPGLPGQGGNGGTASASYNYTASSTPGNLTLQFVIVDPLSLDGFSLSAPTELIIN